ncbi:hypothetical protein I2W78_08290 [Streptomyces spinoverrucosus]|uniref:hypothetical protein n=1 Tax=Streptomyces spinoverrucosus TaxID=284043 RepID=UPI0018C36B18|nr:hypothetical protein [Streptomyces spinoverrucosus]MBG0851843.1 hypothetical protein [Streptomyces spinoverrucosus]
MEYTKVFDPDQVVFRIDLNLPRVRVPDEAVRAWLPLVTELRPVAMEFSEAHPDGLREGFVAQLLVAVPLPEGGPGDALRSLLGTLGAPDLRVTEDAWLEGGQAQAEATGVGTSGPYGAYLVLAAVGHDPLNPEGDRQDYPDSGDDL